MQISITEKEVEAIDFGIEQIREALEGSTNDDWEQRRYEIAKECVAVLMRNEITLEDAAKISVEQADALITELKKKKNQ